ncbi:MAG TPA: PA0069 family radical SAM protein [Planctomycetia bacterium]|nr:PA0069 family radical SAM protein [Planctomycetia bacterium]
MIDPPAKRRGAGLDPHNRFERLQIIADHDQRDPDDDVPVRIVPTEFFIDQSRTVVATNDSPDVGFNYSLNTYRGCEHGCSYCYARPGHEYLGMSAGLDFETRILVKPDAPRLLREFLKKPGWQADHICLSGVTDPYQPIERKLKLTRACLEVMLEFNQPVGIVTKGALIARDVDILKQLAARRLVQVRIAVTTLDDDLQREMEPRAASPKRRLAAMKTLSDAGVPVSLLLAPLIPGLTDNEVPEILRAAAEHGAKEAYYVLLRLPGAVREVFLEWVDRLHPLQRSRIEAAVRSIRSGNLNATAFKERMSGKGERADQIRQLFNVFKKRYGLDGSLPPFDRTLFRVPPDEDGQGRLFD